LLQPVSWVAAAIGVCIAAFYYILNLMETTRNRRASLASTLMQTFISEEGGRRWLDVMAAEWSEPEDFNEKYGPKTNPEYYAKRNAIWNSCELLGSQYRSGVIDQDSVGSE